MYDLCYLVLCFRIVNIYLKSRGLNTYNLNNIFFNNNYLYFYKDIPVNVLVMHP